MLALDKMYTYACVRACVPTLSNNGIWHGFSMHWYIYTEAISIILSCGSCARVCVCCYCCSLTSWFSFFFSAFIYDCFGRLKRWVWLSWHCKLCMKWNVVDVVILSLKVYAMHNCRALIAYVLPILYHFITYFTLALRLYLFISYKKKILVFPWKLKIHKRKTLWTVTKITEQAILNCFHVNTLNEK